MPDIDVTQDANLTTNTSPSLSDRLILIRNSDSALTDITPDQLLKIINLLTADASPDFAADYVPTYDASASAAKRVLLTSFAGVTATQTLTNKTIDLTSNTLTGTKAQFNTAMSDADFATLTGSETLTNKTLTTPVIADFTSAAHDHGDADDGGSLVASITLTTPTIASFTNAAHTHADAAGGGLIAPAVATWSPTWTNLTLGNGVLTTGYTVINKLVFGHLELVFGTGTSISGDVTFSPPVTQGTYGATSAPLGLARLIAGGASFLGTVAAPSTTSFSIKVSNVAGTYLVNNNLSSTVPGTWTTSDVIQIQFMYFAA